MERKGQINENKYETNNKQIEFIIGQFIDDYEKVNGKIDIKGKTTMNRRFKSNILNCKEILECRELFDETLKTGNYKRLKRKIRNSIYEIKKDGKKVKEIYEIIEYELKREKYITNILDKIFEKVLVGADIVILSKIINDILDNKWTMITSIVLEIIVILNIVYITIKWIFIYKDSHEEFLEYLLKRVNILKENERIIKNLKK